jgi:hypothetical protein
VKHTEGINGKQQGREKRRKNTSLVRKGFAEANQMNKACRSNLLPSRIK